MLTVFLAGILVLAFLLLFRIPMGDRLPPGTSLAGVDLSFKKFDAAEKLLTEKWADYKKKPFKISFEKNTATLTAEELGVQPRIRQTLNALQSSAPKNIRLYEIFSPGFARPEMNLIVDIDRNKIYRELNKAFALDKIAPVSATFYFEGKTLKISPEKAGVVIDENLLIENLSDSASRFLTSNLNLKTISTRPQITAETLEKNRDKVLDALRHRFTLEDPIYSDDWHLTLLEHLDWVTFSARQTLKMEGTPYISFLPLPAYLPQNDELIAKLSPEKIETSVEIRIKDEPFNAFVDAELSKWLDVPSEDVTISRDSEGNIQIEGYGNDGKKIQRERLKEAIELAVLTRATKIPIPVATISTQVNVSPELQDLGIKEKIGIGHTSYYGSPANRVYNIKVGSSKFNGLLIPPGETFSFNKFLGPVDAINGYRKELVIKQEGTIPEYGGGICQVSTTMFRAALFSGLPIAERHPHSYVVSYYSQILGHGLDATIYLGGPDLKFRNDTEHHILIQTYTKNDYELYIVFYGTADGRTVRMDGPHLGGYSSPGPTITILTTDLAPGQTKQVEKAHTGMKAVWYRYLTDKNGIETKESIFSTYKAVPAKILVGSSSPPTSAP